MATWPIEDCGPNQVSRRDIKMAMAVWSRSQQYKVKEIQRRHFNAMARRCQYGTDAEALIGQVLAYTRGVIERISAKFSRVFSRS